MYFKGTAPIKYEGSCCPHCVADWTNEKKEMFNVTEGDGPISMECQLHKDILVSPNDVRFDVRN